MVSIRTIVPLVGFSLAFLQGVMAAPAVQCTTTKKPVGPTPPAGPPTPPVVHAPTPALPLTGGATELPQPDAGLQLLHVAVGLGTQNYTCSAAGAVPVSDGAKATLFDVTSLAFQDINKVHQAPPIAVNIKTVPTTNVNIPGVGNFPILGHHTFTPALVPTFDLSLTKQLLSGKKLNSTAAPASASKGPMGTGAVVWLKLGDAGGSIGTTQGYRVVTAGGNAPATCADANLIAVPYSAEYWFYGKA